MESKNTLTDPNKPHADRSFVLTHTPTGRFGTNVIRTAKYTLWSFLPLDIAMQFTKAANIYFVILGILEMIPVINQNAMPTILIALACLVSLSVIKDFFEMLKSWKRDTAQNNAVVHSFDGEDFVDTVSSSLRVGSIVKVS